jgi:hypothetical protein
MDKKQVYGIILGLIIIFSSVSFLTFFSLSDYSPRSQTSQAPPNNQSNLPQEVFLAKSVDAEIVSISDDLFLVIDIASQDWLSTDMQSLLQQKLSLIGSVQETNCFDSASALLSCGFVFSFKKEGTTTEEKKVLLAQIFDKKARLLEARRIAEVNVNASKVEIENQDTNKSIKRDIQGNFRAYLGPDSKAGEVSNFSAYLTYQGENLIDAKFFENQRIAIAPG